MRVMTKTLIGLITLGATGAVVFWRNQQARETARQALERLDTAGASLPDEVQKLAQKYTIASPPAAAPATSTDAAPAAPRAEKKSPVAATNGTTSPAPADDAPTPSAPAAPEVSAPPAELELAPAPTPSSAPAESETVTADAPAEPAAPSESAPPTSDEAVTADAPTESAAQDSSATTPSAEADELAPKSDLDAGELDLDGDDRTIADRVRSNMGRQLDMHEMPRLNINVQGDGVVYLRGTVPSVIHSELVEQVVRDTEDVKQVVNELHIEDGGSKLDDAAPSEGLLENIPNITPKDDPDAGELDADGDDRTTTDRVLSQLGRELESEHLARINVNTQAGGVVYLRGTVKSQEEFDHIQQLVSQIDGVGDVVNSLRIEP